MPREEDAMRGKDAHMQATKREEIFQYSSSSNIPNRGMKLRTCLLGVI